MRKILTMIVVGLAVGLFVTETHASEVLDVDIHGFISEGYLSSTDNDFSKYSDDKDFLFNEVGINFGKEFNDNLHFGIQLFSRDFGEVEMNEINVDWAFADYAFSDAFGFRVGQIKLPHGMYNENRDIDMLHNPIFLPESVYHELSQDVYISDVYLTINGINSRDLYLSLQGLGFYGTFDLSDFGELSYQAMYGTQDLDMKSEMDSTQIKFFSDIFTVEIPNGGIKGEGLDVDYKYAGNLIWDTPLEGCRIGASLNNIRMSSNLKFTQTIEYYYPGLGNVTLAEPGDKAKVDYNKLENWVGSVEYTWRNLILMAEYIMTNKEYDVQVGSLKEEKSSDPWGWYVGGALRLTDWIEVGGYFSQSKNDDMAVTDFTPPIDYFLEFRDICATLRFDITPFWTVKLETHRFKGSYAAADANNTTNPDYTEKENSWNSYAAKLTAAF